MGNICKRDGILWIKRTWNASRGATRWCLKRYLKRKKAIWLEEKKKAVSVFFKLWSFTVKGWHHFYYKNKHKKHKPSIRPVHLQENQFLQMDVAHPAPQLVLCQQFLTEHVLLLWKPILCCCMQTPLQDVSNVPTNYTISIDKFTGNSTKLKWTKWNFGGIIIY